MNSLALVTLRVVAHIDIPDSVIGIVDLDHIGIGIKRHLILKNVVNFAFFILKQNVARLVDYFDAAAEGWKRIFRTAAVEHDHIGIFCHLHEDGFHVLHIDLEAACVDGHDLLYDAPTARQFHFFEFFYAPERVVFENDSLRAVFAVQFFQVIQGKLLWSFYDFQDGVVFEQFFFVVLYFTFFGCDQKGRSVDLEIVLCYGKIDKRGFSTLQKSCYEINRNFYFVFFVHFVPPLSLTYSRNLSALAFAAEIPDVPFALSLNQEKSCHIGFCF